jgi:hypothetical protein
VLQRTGRADNHHVEAGCQIKLAISISRFVIRFVARRAIIVLEIYCNIVTMSVGLGAVATTTLYTALPDLGHSLYRSKEAVETTMDLQRAYSVFMSTPQTQMLPALRFVQDGYLTRPRSWATECGSKV